MSESEFAVCAPALHRPDPRVSLGLALRGLASSAIDISDGLLSDLGHVLEASQLGARLKFAQLPISAVMRERGSQPLARQCILSGGDDYELCFTVPAARHAEVSSIAARLGLPLTCIGKLVAERGCVVHDAAGVPIHVEDAGYDHFR